MKLIQIRENEFINFEAIASVRVLNHVQIDDRVGHPRKKIGEKLTLVLTLIGSEKTVTVSEPLAHAVHELLFPEEIL